VNKSVLLAGAGIVFLAGYYFANYQSEAAVAIEVSESAEPVIEPQKTELLQGDVSNNNLLTTRLNNLDGQQSSLSTINSEYILVNFWATWCKPCVEEMPMLEALQQELGSGQFSIVGLAIDAADPAKKMVEKLQITYPIFIADLEGPELMANNGNEQGLLPYTLLMDADGEVLATKLGAVKEQDIREWLDLVLSATGS
jgi:thiol-disulfide isomerase/thioredoxin